MYACNDAGQGCMHVVMKVMQGCMHVVMKVRGNRYRVSFSPCTTECI